MDQILKWNGSALQEEETEDFEPYVEMGNTNRKREKMEEVLPPRTERDKNKKGSRITNLRHTLEYATRTT